jgi:hypothetical protein
MVTKELLDYVESETILIIGTDLFWGIYPAEDRIGILLSDLGGTHNDTDMGTIQILINARYQDYQTTTKKIELVYNLLAYSNGFTLTSYTVFNSVPVSMPQFLGKSDTGLLMFSAIVNLFMEV